MRTRVIEAKCDRAQTVNLDRIAGSRGLHCRPQCLHRRAIQAKRANRHTHHVCCGAHALPSNRAPWGQHKLWPLYQTLALRHHCLEGRMITLMWKCWQPVRVMTFVPVHQCCGGAHMLCAPYRERLAPRHDACRVGREQSSVHGDPSEPWRHACCHTRPTTLQLGGPRAPS